MDSFVIRSGEAKAGKKRPRERSRTPKAVEVDLVELSDDEVPSVSKRKRSQPQQKSNPNNSAFSVMMGAAKEKPTSASFGVFQVESNSKWIFATTCNPTRQPAWSSTMKLNKSIAGSAKGGKLRLWTSIPSETKTGGEWRRRTRLSTAQLKSLLQKEIRRGCVSGAIRCAIELWEQGFESILELARRLPIICIEDAVAQCGQASVTWLAAAMAKGYLPPRFPFLPLILKVVETAARCPVRDPVDFFPSLSDGARVSALCSVAKETASAGSVAGSGAQSKLAVGSGLTDPARNIAPGASPSGNQSTSLLHEASLLGVMALGSCNGNGLTGDDGGGDIGAAPRLSSRASSSSSSSYSGAGAGMAQDSAEEAGGPVKSGGSCHGCALAMSLLLRRALGGMKFDMGMLAGAQRAWQLRLGVDKPPCHSGGCDGRTRQLLECVVPPSWMESEPAERSTAASANGRWLQGLIRLSSWGGAVHSAAEIECDGESSWIEGVLDQSGCVHLSESVEVGPGPPKPLIFSERTVPSSHKAAGTRILQATSSSSSSSGGAATSTPAVESYLHDIAAGAPRFDTVVGPFGLDFHCSRTLDDALAEFRFITSSSGGKTSTSSSAAPGQQVGLPSKDALGQAMWVFWSGLNVRRSLLGAWQPSAQGQPLSSAAGGGGGATGATESSGLKSASSGKETRSVFGSKHAVAVKAHSAWAAGETTSAPVVRLLQEGPFDVLHSVWPRSEVDLSADPMERYVASSLSGPGDMTARAKAWSVWRRILPLVKKHALANLRKRCMG